MEIDKTLIRHKLPFQDISQEENTDEWLLVILYKHFIPLKHSGKTENGWEQFLFVLSQ